MKTNIIPIFFATDDNYLDYLLVTLASLKDHANKKNQYDLYVLYDHISLSNRKRVKTFEQDNISIRFVNVGLRALRLENNLLPSFASNSLPQVRQDSLFRLRYRNFG